MSTPPESLLEALRDGQRFLLSGHVNPDGDCIGSAIGLARLLRKVGKGATIWNRDPHPALYAQLPGAGAIHSGAEPPAGFPATFDAVVVLECPSLDRTGLEQHLAELPLLNLDHHLGNEQYGAVNWVDTAAPALGAMIYRLAPALNVEIDSDTATCLYLTLVTDTGGFRFDNASPEAFATAGRLVADGASPTRVAGWLYENRPLAAVRLLGEMIQTLELHAGGRIATALLRREMYERSGAAAGDGEGLIDHPRSIAGVEAVGLVREIDGDGCKVSLRSRGRVDVQAIALRHGGGGHRNAAGYRLAGTPDEVRATVADELAGALSAEG